MIEMYKGIANSPVTELKESISAQATVIKVNNINAFPQGPNLAVIGTDENAETIKYATKTTNALSGCQRGVEGIAKVWNAGEKIARNFTNKDHADLVDNVKELNESKASTQEVEGLRQTVNQKASTVALQELSDKVNTLERKPSSLEVADGVYNNNFISIDDFTPKDGVPFLLNMFRVPRDNMQIDANTRIGFGRGEPLIITKFNDVIFHDAMQVKQRQFICVKKENNVWIEVYSAELDNKIFELQQRVSEAFQSANNAKNQLVGAIIGMGGSASTSESFSELIEQYKERTEYTIITQPKIPILQVGDNRSFTRKYFIFDKVVKVEDGRTLLLFRLPARMENRLKSYKKMTVRLELGEASGNFNRVRIYMTYENGDAIKEIAEVTRSDFDEGGLSCTKEIYAPFVGPLVQSATNYRIAVEVEGIIRSVIDAIGAEIILIGNGVHEFRIWFS